MRSLHPGRLLDDDRGQSVQVGAAILLGFVVIAITMYQVQVVPDQNADVEFNHNQDAREDMIDLRNAISEVGNEDTTRSVSVKMGTQYPPRSIFVNPPPPRGTLRTESIGDISISNATVVGEYTGKGDPVDIVNSNHTTSNIFYQPDYTEFDSAPTTYVEHSLAYDSFPNGFSQAVTPQSIINNNNSITLTVLRGNVSEQGSGTFSLDPRTVSGPTEPIKIRESNGDPITITLPTATPEVWNKTFAEDSDVEVDHNPGTGTVSLVLNKTNYNLQMAMVGVGDGVPSSDLYDVQQEGGSGNDSNAAYSVQWSSSQSDGALTDCDSAGCDEDYQVVVGTDDVNLTSEINPSGITGAEVDFSYLDSGVGVTEGPANGSEYRDGSATYELENFDQEGTVQAYVASGGTSDAISIEVIGGLLPNITDSNSPVEGGEELSISTEVQNTGDQEATENVELSLSGRGVVDSQSVTVAPGGTETVTLTWQTSDSDLGEYEATVQTPDAADSTSVVVQNIPLPANAVGYADENGNGEYDEGEQTYQEGDLSGISTSYDVYIVRDASVGSIDVQGGAVIVESSATLISQNNQVSFQSSTGEVRIAGTVETPGGASLSISSAGATNLTDATLRTHGPVSIQSSGQFYGDRLTLDIQVSWANVQISGDSGATFRNAVISGGAQYQISFSGTIEMSGTTLESDVNYASMTITSENGGIVADDGTISSGSDLELVVSDDLSLQNSLIEARNGGASMSGDMSDNSNLYVEGTEFVIGGSSGTFDYSPNGVTVIGTPARGTTS